MENLENGNEEQLYLTVQEAAEQLLMSQSSVYSWVERGRLEAEELPSGKIIVISRSELEKIRKINTKSKRNKVSKQPTVSTVKSLENSVIDAEITEISDEFQQNPETRVSTSIPESSNKLQDSIELAKLISDLSAKAGKYELLSDLQKENRENAEYWKNEFFRLQNENNEIKVENIMLKKELKQARKGLFGLFRRKDDFSAE